MAEAKEDTIDENLLNDENQEPNVKQRRPNHYSFLVGRDTTISRPAYKINPKNVKNLDFFAEDTNDSNDEASSSDLSSSNTNKSTSVENHQEKTSTYLRLRPVETTRNPWKFRIADNYFIASNIENELNRNKDITEKHYQFSNIFDANVPQSQVYNTIVEPLVSAGENATVLAYGTSGSGKTFTLHGNMSNPGLVPRAIKQIFTQYSNNIAYSPRAKSVNGMLNLLSDDQADNECDVKNHIIAVADEKRKSGKKALVDLECDFYRMNEIIKSEHQFESSFLENTEVYVWISFAEIYNEYVYDLLSIAGMEETTGNCNRYRSHLKVFSNDGDAYVKDLTMVYARNDEEALKILEVGLNRVSRGATNVNSSSTRSHCILFIDVIQFRGNGEAEKISYKFCDLAGSERLTKTDTKGKNLREAQNINKSLMCLGRCLSSVYKQQNSSGNESIIVPYRDSKLTTLLQSALMGQDKITMIVNLMPRPEFVEENIQVLHFASIANKIVIRQRPKEHRRVTLSRFSVLTACSSYSEANSITSGMLNATAVTKLQQDNRMLLEENTQLRMKMEEIRRQKMFEDMAARKALIDSMEVDYQKRNQLHEDILTRTRERYNKQMQHKIEEIAELKHRIEDLEDELDQFEDKYNRLKRLLGGATTVIECSSSSEEDDDTEENISVDEDPTNDDLNEKEFDK